MTDLDDFLADVLPRMESADTLLHDGDATERAAMWSRSDPITLFGAAFNAKGWHQVAPVFETLAERFSNCESWQFEVLAAGLSSDLGYTVGIERTRASIGDAPPTPYALRVTTIFRREDGQWKIVHRHGDPFDDAAGTVAERLQDR